MQNKILLFIVIVLAVIHGIQRSFISKTSFSSENITILNTENNQKEILEMENYLIGVIAAEMPASFEEEALKAQAIASRTYAYYKIKTSNLDYDLTNDITTQAYIDEKEMHDKWDDDYAFYFSKIKTAVEDTKDLVLTYEDKVISAYYFSMSNGQTENASLVFNEDKSYLVSVTSNEPITNQNFEVTKIISIDEFCQSLDINIPIQIGNINKSSSNRVNTITINNKEYKGTKIRNLLGLRSTDFTINVGNESVYITTKGYGHGVGMSQYGANEMAKSGSSYENILLHYYTGVKIKNINSIK